MTNTEHAIRQLDPSPYDYEAGHWKGGELRLLVEGARWTPGFGLGYVDASGEARRTHGGPKLPGPYAYAFGIAGVIDNHGGTAAEIEKAEAEGLIVRCAVGDTLVMPDGERFLVEWDGWQGEARREHVRLVHVS